MDSKKRIKFRHESTRFGKENELLSLELDAAISFFLSFYFVVRIFGAENDDEC